MSSAYRSDGNTTDNALVKPIDHETVSEKLPVAWLSDTINTETTTMESDKRAEKTEAQMAALDPASLPSVGVSQNTEECESKPDAVASTSRDSEPGRLPMRKRMHKTAHAAKKRTPEVSDSGGDSSSENEFQIVDSTECLSPDIDDRLEENATKNKLNAINVKNILREVLTNEQVVNMLRNTLQVPSMETTEQSPEPPVFELRMTRSKVKKVLKEEKVPKPWPASQDGKPSFLDLEFPDDEEDDEYNPDEETIDEEKEAESEVSSLQIDDVAEEEPVAGDIIATRTRSKLPLTGTKIEEIEEAFVAPDITADMYETKCDDSEWQEFLHGLVKTDPVVTSVESIDEDPNDPDFNYLAAPENEEEDEDFKFEYFDRPFRVSKQEVNQLIDDLREWFPDDDDDAENDNGKGNDSKATSASVEKTDDTHNSPSCKGSSEELMEEDLENRIPIVNADQMETLKAQLQKHIQLITQLNLLSLSDPVYQPHVTETKKMLVELDMLQRISIAGEKSMYRACSVQEAIKVVNTVDSLPQMKTKSVPCTKNEESPGAGYYFYRFPLYEPQLSAMFNSPVFMDPDLLPKRGLLGSRNRDRRTAFTKSEDMLILLGLEQFQIFSTKKYAMIHNFLVPCKDAVQIKKRVINMGQCKSSEDNPFKYFKTHKLAPPCECRMLPQQPRAPRERPLESLPTVWRKHAEKYAYRRRKSETSSSRRRRKRSRSTSSSRERRKKRRRSSTVSAKPRFHSAPNSPKSEGPGSDPEQSDRKNLLRIPKFGEIILPLEALDSDSFASEIKNRACSSPRNPQEMQRKEYPMKGLEHSFVKIAPKSLPTGSEPAVPAFVKLPKQPRVKKTNLSPKKALIFPKNYIAEHKNISPTKRAALSLRKRAQQTYHKSSPSKIALPPRNWAAYAKSISSVHHTRAVTRRTLALEANPLPCMPQQEATVNSEDEAASGLCPKTDASAKEKSSAVAQDDTENEQSDDMMDDVNKDEENEQAQEDDADHLDQLMAASTTVRFDPRKASSTSASRPSRTQRRKDLKLSLLSGDIVEMDPKRDDRDTVIAQEFLSKVRQALVSNLDCYMKFLRSMSDFGNGRLSAVELYNCVKVLLKDHPDLIEDFSSFLLPEQAVQCNCFMPNNEFHHARTFLRKLELCFEKQPTQFQKVLKVFSDWHSKLDKSADELRDLLRPFMRHIPDLVEELSSFFAEEKPPESLMSEFESLVLDEDTLESENVEEMEEIDFPDDADPYRTMRCPCHCHEDATDEKCHKRLKHCLKCSLKVIYGKVFFQFSKKRLIPACITYFDPLPDGRDAPDSREDNMIFSLREDRNFITNIASTGTAATPSQPLKRMKLKTRGAGSGNKRFLSLSEVLVSPSKVETAPAIRGGSDDDEPQDRHARVITEVIPRYRGSPSAIAMQPTALESLSEEGVSCDKSFPCGMADSDDGNHQVGSSDLRSLSSSSSERKEGGSFFSEQRPVTSTAAGGRSVPHVVLRFGQAADGSPSVYVTETSGAAADRVSGRQTVGQNPFEAAMSPSLCTDSMSSPAKSLDGSGLDLLSKAMRHARIKQSDSELSMDANTTGIFSDHSLSHFGFSLQAGKDSESSSASSCQTHTVSTSLGGVQFETAASKSFMQLNRGDSGVDSEGQSHLESLPPGAEPTWTRQIDKHILEMCKEHGPEPETFQRLEEVLPGRTAEQLEERFNTLMEILATTQQ